MATAYPSGGDEGGGAALTEHVAETAEADDVHGARTYTDGQIAQVEADLAGKQDAASAATDAELAAGLATKQSTSEKGQASGYASLDGGGKVPATQLPNSVMELQGAWNAATNTPPLADGTGNPGDCYRVSNAGTRDLGSGPINFKVNDTVLYGADGKWFRSRATDEVLTVFGRNGDVVAQPNDYAVSDINGLPAALAAKQDALGALPPPPVDRQVFTADGTWTKPTAPAGFAPYSVCQIFVIGGGGGGGSGRRSNSGAAAGGGAGGGPGGVTDMILAASQLGANEPVVVGAGGAGGAAITAGSTNGSAGSAGGVSRIGGLLGRTVANANGGAGGGGGTGAAAAAAGAGGGGSRQLASGGAGGGSGAAGVVGQAASGAAGGGGGGGVNTTPAFTPGADGGVSYTMGRWNAMGTAGATDGAAGGAATFSGSAGDPNVGRGGGGGAGSVSGNGGAGGNGGSYGGGGGGGGGSTGAQSGAGGNGAGGLVIVVTR